MFCGKDGIKVVFIKGIFFERCSRSVFIEGEIEGEVLGVWDICFWLDILIGFWERISLKIVIE